MPPAVWSAWLGASSVCPHKSDPAVITNACRSCSAAKRSLTPGCVPNPSNKQIAQILNISVKTVEVHRASVLRKLDLISSAALVRYAVRKLHFPLSQRRVGSTPHAVALALGAPALPLSLRGGACVWTAADLSLNALSEDASGVSSGSL